MRLWKGWPWQSKLAEETKPGSSPTSSASPAGESSFPDIQDKVLGKLVWVEDEEWWSGTTEIGGVSIELFLSSDDVEPDGIAALIKTAHTTLSVVRRKETSFKIAAADELLELHNETWNEGEPIDRDTFTSRMGIESLTISADGSAELSYDDGDLFWGHSIYVSFEADGTVTDASFQG